MPLIFHGTSSNNISGIVADGLTGPSYWGTEAVAAFFADQECEKVGGCPTLLAVDLERFDQAELFVDTQMLEFPVLTDLAGADHGQLEAEWERSAQTWRDCLAIYESVVYRTRLIVTEDMIADRSLDVGMPRL